MENKSIAVRYLQQMVEILVLQDWREYDLSWKTAISQCSTDLRPKARE